MARAGHGSLLWGAYIIRKVDLTETFLRYDFGGLIFGEAYTCRGLFSEFYGISDSNHFFQILLVAFVHQALFGLN